MGTPAKHVRDRRAPRLRLGGRGLRYVHLFDEAELGCLAAEAGLVIADTYLSDGEGGRLGLYQVWRCHG
jgi:hypothetical protein